MVRGGLVAFKCTGCVSVYNACVFLMSVLGTHVGPTTTAPALVPVTAVTAATAAVTADTTTLRAAWWTMHIALHAQEAR